MNVSSDSSRKQLTDVAISFYDENICPLADVAFRFCYSMLLNMSGAKDMIPRIYQKAVESLDELIHYDRSSLRVFLLYYAFKSYKDFEGQYQVEKSPLSNLFEDLPYDKRALFMAVDVLGLDMAEAASVFSESEDDLRAQLAEIREKILSKF